MSLTERDEPALKVPPADTSDADQSDAGAETMTKTPCAASDVMATLCRMSLLRNESLSVNGAYVRRPPELA